MLKQSFKGFIMQSRIYKDRIDINNNDTKKFWYNRGEKLINLTSVLLGADKDSQAQIDRNNKEKEILISLINNKKNLKVLDIGCGIGRWADNLINYIDSYIGIDYSKGFIEYAKEKYNINPKIKFYEMSLLEISEELLSQKFDLIICTGVLMYVNDNNLLKIFENIKKMLGEYLYIQESISIMDKRLTLNNFESDALKANYSAIYRMSSEYEIYFKRFNLEIINTNLLLDDKIGARQETNARYWLLKG